MAHETRTNPDSAWVDGHEVTRAEWESLDAKAFRSINGVRGGCWAPTSPISLQNLSGEPVLEVTGPVEIKGFGNLEILGSSTLTLEGDHFPLLEEGHVGRERAILQDTLPSMTLGAYPWGVGFSAKYYCAQPLALTLRDSSGVESTPEFLVPLRVHNKSTLERAIFHFRVPEGRTRAPASMPKFRIFRVDPSGIASELKSTANGDGFASPDNPGSAAAWFAGGEPQQFVYECDQNNVIDTSTYRYFAHVVEEGGAVEYPGRLTVFTAAAIMAASRPRPAIDPPVPDDPAPGYDLSTLDGTDIVDGTTMGQVPARPFILKDQKDPTENGIFQGDGTGSGPIDRSPLFDETNAAQMANGTLFPISPSFGATANAYTVWQISLPSPFVPGVSPVQFNPPVPRGNIYHSIETFFGNILTTEWQ